MLRESFFFCSLTSGHAKPNPEFPFWDLKRGISAFIHCNNKIYSNCASNSINARMQEIIYLLFLLLHDTLIASFQCCVKFILNFKNVEILVFLALRSGRILKPPAFATPRPLIRCQKRPKRQGQGAELALACNNCLTSQVMYSLRKFHPS